MCIAGFRHQPEYQAMTVRSKITIFNAALSRTGNGTSIDGSGSTLWEALEANYDEIVREAFEDQEYPFGKARVELTSRSDGRFGYDDAFTLPHGSVHILHVYVDDFLAETLGESWDLDASTNELMINANKRKIEVEHIKVGLEHTWSSTFTLGIQRRCEAVIKDVEEESGEAAQLDSSADFQLMKSGVKASKNRSRTRVRKGGRLVRAHRGWYGRS